MAIDPFLPEAVAHRRHRWDMFNVSRIFAAMSLFTPRESAVFGALPLLLNSNCTGIEGLKPVAEAPAGIQLFTPRPQHQSALAEIAPGAVCRPVTPPRIVSLALVGSLGTVAQTAKSDFDCIVFVDRRELAQTEQFALTLKLSAIEQWLHRTTGVEAHFFVQDTGEFRLNLFGRTDRENVGSALGKLFKDEFYRTAIWIAGRKPLWWIIPPDYPEPEAAGLAARLKKEGLPGIEEYFDLGHLLSAGEDEFFGAALWQINKALGSPFKSVLKMGLLESYLFNPVAGLMCEEIKRFVLDEAIPPEVLDPYLMLYERGVSFYAGRGMMNEATLLRWAFILKTAIEPDDIRRLLRANPDLLTPKERTLADVMKRWGWHGDEADDLQTLFAADPAQRIDSVGKVYRFFIDAYIRLADYRKTHGGQFPFITQEDMTVLGRKLFTHFEQAPGKIGFVHHTAPLTPSKLTLMMEKTIKGERIWSLYTGSPSEVTAGVSTVRPLLQVKSLVEAAAWLVINGVWRPETRLYFRVPKGMPYTAAEVEFLLKELHGWHAKSRYEPDRNDFLSGQLPVQAFIITNFGLGETPGEIRRVDMVLHNTWGEFHRLRMGINQALMETAMMSSRAEEAGKTLSLTVTASPAQNDPRLVQEFEYSLAKTREALAHDTTLIRKATLDLD